MPDYQKNWRGKSAPFLWEEGSIWGARGGESSGIFDDRESGAKDDKGVVRFKSDAW